MTPDLRRVSWLTCVAALCLAVAVGRPSAQQAAGAPVIAGDVTEALSITPADLKTMPRTTVTVDENGRQIRHEGVLVGELLKRAGVPLGKDLSGKAVATYVRASAKDGYQVVFALPELDPAFTASDIIVADTIDGQPLFDYKGPCASSPRTTSGVPDRSGWSSGSRSSVWSHER
jgi:hypothetical protein